MIIMVMMCVLPMFIYYHEELLFFFFYLSMKRKGKSQKYKLRGKFILESSKSNVKIKNSNSSKKCLAKCHIREFVQALSFGETLRRVEQFAHCGFRKEYVFQKHGFTSNLQT